MIKITQTKICTKCKQSKELHEYSKDNKSLDKHRADCKECRKIFVKNRYKKQYNNSYTSVEAQKKKEYYLKNKNNIL